MDDVVELAGPVAEVAARSVGQGVEQQAEVGTEPRRGDAGMATAEYAIATLAACGFAGLLVTILRGGEVRDLLFGIVQRALSLA